MIILSGFNHSTDCLVRLPCPRMRKLQTEMNGQRPYPGSCMRRLTVSKGADSLREPLHQQEDSATDNASPEQSADSQNQESGSTATCFVRFIKMFESLFVHRITPDLPPEKLREPVVWQTVCRLSDCLLKCKLVLTSVSLALRLLRPEYSGRRLGIGLSKCKLNCSHKTGCTVSTGVDDRLALNKSASGNCPFISDNRFKFGVKEKRFGHPNKGSQFFAQRFVYSMPVNDL